MGRKNRINKVTVQGVNNPVPAASVGVTTSHVSSRSSDCDPAVLGVDALAPTAVPATSASIPTPKLDDDPAIQKEHDLARAGESQSTADRTAVVGGDDLHGTLRTIHDSLERQSRELLDQLDRLVPEHCEDTLPEELLHNLTLTDDELDTTVIPAKSTQEGCCDTDKGSANPDTQPDAGPIPTGPVSAPADNRLQRQTATEMMSDDGDSNETPTTGSDSKVASAREASDARHYKRAVSYLRKFVGRDSILHSAREVHLIRGKLKFIRKYERTYPHEFHRELQVERIFLPDKVVEPAKPTASGKCATPKPIQKLNPNRQVKEKAIECTPKPTGTPSDDRPVKDSASKPDSAPKGKGEAAGNAGLNRKMVRPAKETSSSGGTNNAPQNKSVKRVRSSEGPQPSPKKTMTSQLVEPSTSYAAAAERTTKGKQPSTEKASTSSGKVNPKARGQGRKKPYSKPVTVADDKDLHLAIIDRADPNGRISDSHWLLFEIGLRSAIVSGPEDQEDRQFGSAFLRKGVKVINCLNKKSRDFLVRTVEGFGALWEGANLAAVPLTDIPSRKVISAWIPPPTVDKELLLKMLRLQNPNLTTSGWTVISLAPCNEDGGLVARVAVDTPGELYLRERKRQRLRILQINLHHCKAAAAELLLSLTTSEVDIVLVQEPYIYKNKVSGLSNANFDIFAATEGDKVRTCIVGKKSLNLIFLSNYSNGDMCTVRLEHGTGMATLLSSVYMSFEAPDPLNLDVRRLLDDMMGTCNVILGCDANAHHFQWGSKDTNKRGESIFDFILSYNLRICNRGNDPTFKIRDREEVIDLTLSNLDDSVLCNWRVSKECSFSDHMKISFDVILDGVAKCLIGTRE
ncbi:uncharacterized protein [Musca autumnalis]|uniref:uncharacterized protein n=1 Tax=Musca autumnalis TaxID=221902 RepID=UPI003CF162D8